MTSTIPRGFVDLQKASNRINDVVNLIGVVTDVLPIAKSRGTDWMCTFSISDHTFGQYDNGLKVRVFKPEPDLPKVRGIGDVVVLRNIKITEWSGMTVALASNATTWTVFPASSIPEKPPLNSPPEMLHAICLCNSRDRSSFTLLPVATPQISTIPSTQGAQLVQGRRDKFSLIKDVEVGKFYDLVGQVVKIYPANGHVELYITDYTPNHHLYNYEWNRSGQGDEYSRDGDEYSYLPQNSSHKKWPGPFGRQTLMVTLWPAHSYFAQENVKEQHFVFLRNVHIKYSKDAKVEGAMHTDTRQNDRVDVSILKDHRDDDSVKNVLRRKKEYSEKFENTRQNVPGEVRGEKRGLKEKSETLSKGQARKRRKLLKEELVHARKEPGKETSKKRNENDKNEDPQIPPRPKSSKQEVNKNVHCSNPLIPPRSLSSILSLSTHALTTPDGTPYTLPFQNVNSRTIVRVIDFFPPDLADFAVRCPRVSEYDVLSDYENSDTTDDDESDGPEDEEREWEWRFGLVLEDAVGSQSEKRTTMRVYVADKDAEFLLKLDAENLRASPNALASLREKLFLLWGDLEERKSAAHPTPLPSNPLHPRSTNLPPKPTPDIVPPPRSLPFQCCIKEYGVRSRRAQKIAREGQDGGCETEGAGRDGRNEEGREGSREWGWERRWRMWGATIV